MFANISAKSKHFKIKYYRLNGNSFLHLSAKFHQNISNRTKVISLLVSPPSVFWWFKNVTQQKTILLSHFSNDCYQTALIIVSQLEFNVSTPVYTHVLSLFVKFWCLCSWVPEVNLPTSTSMWPSILLSFLALVADCGISPA